LIWTEGSDRDRKLERPVLGVILTLWAKTEEALFHVLFSRNREAKIGRNDPCPCGSGLKYKKCCMGKESLGSVHLKEKYYREHRIRLKEKADIEAIKSAGRIALATLDLVEEKLKPGMATDEINTLVHEFTVQNGAVPAPLN
jgi:methionyl aminopeptidase